MTDPKEIVEFVQGSAVLLWRDQDNMPGGEELKRVTSHGKEFGVGVFGFVKFGPQLIHAHAVVPEKVVDEKRKAFLFHQATAQLVNAVVKIVLAAEAGESNGRQEVFAPRIEVP